MAENWDFYLCHIDDVPASIFVNLDLIRLAPMGAFPSMAYLRIYMKEPRSDGLSSAEEFETLSEIDDKILAAFNELGKSTYAGRTTTDGMRTYYFYVPEVERFDATVAKAMCEHPDYEYETGHRDDPEWRIYKEFLFPSSRDRQRMANRHVLDALAEQGDAHDIPREIDHFAYFPDVQAAATFAHWVESEEFVGVTVESHDGEHCVQFKRVNSATEIDSVTIPLFNRAAELGGDYDGWGCPVEKPN